MALPYNDDNLYYNLDLRMYVLTENACDDFMGEDLLHYFDGNTTKYQRFREEISEDLYNHIYSFTYINRVPSVRYVMAKNEKYRDVLKKAMLYQLRYNFRSSANLLKDMHGVHVEKSKALNLNSIRGLVGISPSSHRILSESGLLYTGNQITLKIEEDGTY